MIDRETLERLLVVAESYVIAVLQEALWPDRQQVDRDARHKWRAMLLECIERLEEPQ